MWIYNVACNISIYRKYLHVSSLCLKYHHIDHIFCMERISRFSPCEQDMRIFCIVVNMFIHMSFINSNFFEIIVMQRISEYIQNYKKIIILRISKSNNFEVITKIMRIFYIFSSNDCKHFAYEWQDFPLQYLLFRNYPHYSEHEQRHFPFFYLWQQ